MRILIFGDTFGIPQLLRHVLPRHICGFVVASNRPQYHEAVERIAVEMNLPWAIQPLPASNNYKVFLKWVDALSPELIWANSYSMIVRNDVLNIPRFGGINIHAALLPQYRGCNPTEWAILNGENITGVTLHEMTLGIDEGGIIDQKIVPLYYEDTWRSAQDRIIEATHRLITENLEPILAGKWHATTQNKMVAQYHRRRFPEDGKFQWSQPVCEIYNLVRALVAPHPGASYIEEDGSTVVISDYKTPAALTSLKYGQLGSVFLQGKDIYLRPLGIEDTKIYLEWSMDREPSILGTQLQLMPQSDHVAWFEERLFKRTDMVAFVIERIETKGAIGICQLSNINWGQRSADLQIRIVEASAKNNVVETEAIRLLTNYGFEELNLMSFSRNFVFQVGP